MQTMKVLEINSVCGRGSTGKIATDIAAVLQDNGHECAIAYGRYEYGGSIPTIRIGNKLTVYMHGVKSFVSGKHGFGSKRATELLIKKINDYKPDIIHLHNIHGYYINIEVLFKYIRENRIPVVWTLHDCWTFTGHCAYFTYNKCDKWKDGCQDCAYRKSYPKSIVDKSEWNYQRKKEIFTSLDNALIVTPSAWLANLVHNSFLQKYSIKVINNGIDLSVFNNKHNSFAEKYNIKEKIILGVADAWSQRKGLQQFVELSEVLPAEYKIVLVGTVDNQQLPSNIIAFGRTQTQKQLAEIYASAYAFVNPTLEDNFPTVNLEALACGTPVITFDTGGSPETVDKTCGIVTSEKSVQGLMEAIKSLETSGITSEACMNRAKQFDRVKRVNDYLKLYKELLS